MKYTVKFDLDMDEEGITSDSILKDYLENAINSPSITIRDFEVLETND